MLLLVVVVVVVLLSTPLPVPWRHPTAAGGLWRVRRGRQ